MADGKKSGPSKVPPARVGLWFILGGVGLYFLVSGLIGILGG